MDEKQARQEIRNARGNVRALSVILGLIAERYDLHLGGQFIRECVELKQIDELRERMPDTVVSTAGGHPAFSGGDLPAGVVQL